MISHFYFEKVKSHFNGDVNKTWDWFNNPNSDLGLFSPKNLIELGKENKVKKYIDSGFKPLSSII